MARGLFARLRGHGHRGQPRPRVHGQHGGPRGRGGQRPGEPLQGQLLGLPQNARGAPGAPARRGGEAGRGDRPYGGVHREVPLQGHEVQAGAGSREEAREDQARRASRGEEDRQVQLQAAPAHGRRGGARPRPREALRRQGRVRRLRLHHVPRRQDRARGPQRRGQVDAAQDDRGRHRARCGHHRVRRARVEDLLRAAPAGGAASRQHRVRRARPRGAGLERLAGAHASGRVFVHGRRGGQEGERAVRWREEPSRAGEDAGGPAAAPMPRRADEPPRHRQRRHPGAGAQGVRGHDTLHHARPPPHPRGGEPHRGDRARARDELRRRLRLLPVQERTAGRRRP